MLLLAAVRLRNTLKPHAGSVAVGRVVAEKIISLFFFWSFCFSSSPFFSCGTHPSFLGLIRCGGDGSEYHLLCR
ncbi:hypothetical protein B0H66DRAFT_111388 [Apodospora peruviana]|uniref:Uncharacterized protein n=1 Tax=Apodospora peruviana TaxID=516989 RepID=A0AAE0MAM9_9PEZI|nr:hypothetical protein B0H66DRAFT_111388 [Apodospora peruviana]